MGPLSSDLAALPRTSSRWSSPIPRSPPSRISWLASWVDRSRSRSAGNCTSQSQAVLRILDSTGQNTIAFAKVGVTEFTRSLVQREAEGSSGPSEHQWRALRCPKVIGYEDFNSCSVLLMSALPGRGTTGMPKPVDEEP